jgi:hypothetical protein
MIERAATVREPIVTKRKFRVVTQSVEIRINHEIDEIHENNQTIQ